MILQTMYASNINTFLVGLSLAFAFDDLSKNKDTLQAPVFPGKVITPYDAGNAVDRNVTTCMRTDNIGTSSNTKFVWWTVDFGGVYNIYSINILFKNYTKEEKNRQRGRFAGFSLYISKTDHVPTIREIQKCTPCYKDGPTLPPLNFSTTCIEYGRYVIFYNERMDGITYPSGYELTNVFTELCEVIVKGCKEHGVYGYDCKSHCPIHCKNKECHILNGTCFTCEPGFYGRNCSNACPSNCNADMCYKESGTCLTCIPGWTGKSCEIKCNSGWFGINCSQQCVGHCKDDTTCNHVTGQCDRGCDAGWTGSVCEQECNAGSYGFDCVNNCSGHCINGSTCNKQTGHCDRGCNPGYTNYECNKECSLEYFGMDCKEQCSGHCINNAPCDHVSGVCPSGCQDGFVGTHCNNECTGGFYGKNCSLVCSPNCKPDTCRYTDGICTCAKGWMGLNCTTECILSFGENCQYQCTHCINHECDRFNGSCVYGCKDGETCKPDVGKARAYSSSDNLYLTVGGTFGACVVIIIGILIAVFVIRIKRKATKMTKRESIVLSKPQFALENVKRSSYNHDGSQEIEQTNNTSWTTYAMPEKTKRGHPTNKNISVRNMKAHVSNMSANESAGFKKEYNDIPRGEQNQSLEGKKPENKVKNRYTTIHPYDHSRVILKTSSSAEGNYINANFIENSQAKRKYIATQGPKPNTIADFWTMVWQEEVYNIVCLTNLKEGTKNKCAQYWPDINDKLQGGTLTVRHLEEKTYAEYTMRRFKIHNKMIRTDRNVTMFHYTTWSDHGVADPLSLVVFHRHVIRATANSAGKYTVVHCSAGVGRTGTYIALDALYREGERTGKINVPMYVRTMRKDRMNMIQGDEQYKLLYFALMEAFSGPSRCMTTEKFVGAYQEQTCYTNCGDVVQKSSQSSEFEELLSLRKEYTQQDYTSGRAQISANYTQSVLPVEEFMCHLSYIKGRNTYYNAALLQSYLEKDSLISAQYPLPDNTEDFLRLIKDFDARVVVFLCPLKDIESTPAWFPTDNQSKLNGHFFIKNISTIKVPNVLMTKLNIQPQGFSEMNTTVIECPTWREGKWTADKRVLLDVIKAVKTAKSDQEGRIVVLSSDGATRCGPFFVVYNVLEQISVDREVDIFTTTRQLQVRRQEFVSTLEEYQLCHDTVAEYLLNDCVYGNC